MNIENNKIIAIAEFLGYVLRGKNTYEYKNKLYLVEELKFHNDWNLLMEVVEKIESLEFKPKTSTCIGFDSFGIEIDRTRCDITRYGDFTSSLLQGNGKTRIESTYNACLEFIKWYNQQEK